MSSYRRLHAPNLQTELRDLEPQLEAGLHSGASNHQQHLLNHSSEGNESSNVEHVEEEVSMQRKKRSSPDIQSSSNLSSVLSFRGASNLIKTLIGLPTNSREADSRAELLANRDPDSARPSTEVVDSFPTHLLNRHLAEKFSDSSQSSDEDDAPFNNHVSVESSQKSSASAAASVSDFPKPLNKLMNRSTPVTDFEDYDISVHLFPPVLTQEEREVLSSLPSTGFGTVPTPENDHTDQFFPACALFMLGFFFVFPWVFGALYMKATNPTARTAGVLSLVLALTTAVVVGFVYFAQK